MTWCGEERSTFSWRNKRREGFYVGTSEKHRDGVRDAEDGGAEAASESSAGDDAGSSVAASLEQVTLPEALSLPISDSRSSSAGSSRCLFPSV